MFKKQNLFLIKLTESKFFVKQEKPVFIEYERY